MLNTISALQKGFLSSSGETAEYKSFASTFKREFTKELQSVGAEKIEIKKGHFYLSGFYTVGSQSWYFSIGDVRGPVKEILYRKCRDYKDFSGERNQYVKIGVGMAKAMHSPRE